MSYIYEALMSGKTQYKIYFVYKATKIYLGSYSSMEIAQKVLEEADELMETVSSIPSFDTYTLNYKKIIVLCNLRDHKKYIKNPIYLYPTYFHYYLSKDCILTFDLKDLLYFSTYKVYKRGNYIYTQDGISQQNILARFGIPNHSVINKDYRFKNNDPYDFRAQNLEIINSYKGVTKKIKGSTIVYSASIYIHGNLTIGHYHTETEAAVAYNKAVDLLTQQGLLHDHPHNHIPLITKDEYDSLYHSLPVSSRLTHPEHQRKRVISAKRFRGISKDNNSYKVHIGYQGKQLYLGMYPTEKRAAQAYNYASFYLFGRSGYVNEVSPLIYDGDSSKIAAFLSKYHILKSEA